MAFGRLGLSLGLSGGGGGTGIPQLTMTGLDDSGSTDAALVGSHGSISVGFPSGVTAWSSQAWGTAYGDDTYGTGANPTDIAAGVDGTLFWQGVGDDGNTYRANAPIWYALGTASAIADGQSWTIDDTSVNLDGSASGTGLTFTYELSGSTSGVTINSGTGAITGTPFEIAPSSGAATITATDQYGRTYTDTFTWSVALRTQATGGTDLDLSYTQDSAITPQDLIANWTDNGNTLTLVSVSPSLPAGLSVSSAGSLSGTPTVSAADDTYTITMQDEYGRETSDTFTLQVTAAAVNPTLNSLTFAAGGSGSPDTLTASITYTGGDSLQMRGVTSTSGTAPSKADIAAGTGTGSLEEFTASVANGVPVDLSALLTATSESATHIHAYIEEVTNGGESAVDTEAVSGLDFTVPTLGTLATDSVDGTEVTGTFSETVYGTETASNWTINGDTPDSVTLNGGTSFVADMTSNPIASGDTPTLSYSGGNVRDAKGNPLATISGAAITNNVPAASGITITETARLSASMSGTTHTFGSVACGADEIWVLLGMAHSGTGGATVVTVNGVSAVAGAGITSADGILEARIAKFAAQGAGNYDIVIDPSGGATCTWGGIVVLNVAKSGGTTLGTEGTARGSQVLAVDCNTTAGGAVVAVSISNTGGTATASTWTGLTKRGTDVDVDTGDILSVAWDTGVAAETPRSIDVDAGVAISRHSAVAVPFS